MKLISSKILLCKITKLFKIQTQTVNFLKFHQIIIELFERSLLVTFTTRQLLKAVLPQGPI